MNTETFREGFRFALSSLGADGQPLPDLVAMHPDARMFLIVEDTARWPNTFGLTCDRDGRYHLDGIPIHLHTALPVGSFRLFSAKGWADWTAEKGAS